MADILFCGYFGFGNLGDEAILQALAAEVRRRRPDIELAALAGPCGLGESVEVEPVPRSSGAAVRTALRRSRIVCIGPGGIYQDSTSIRSCAWYAWLAWAARRRGCRIAHIAQGIGPLRSAIGRRLAGWALAMGEAVTVRDAASAALARELAPHVPVEVTADAAWLLAAAPPDSGARRSRVVALAPRPWRGALADSAWWARVGIALTDAGYRVVLLGLARADARLLEQVARLTHGKISEVVGVIDRVDDALRVLRGCEAVVAMRFHALVLGAIAGAGLVGVSYDPKVDSLLASLGLASLGSAARPLEPESVVHAVGRARERGTPWEVVEAQRDLAVRNADVLLAML